MIQIEKRMQIKVANRYYYDHMKQADIAITFTQRLLPALPKYVK